MNMTAPLPACCSPVTWDCPLPVPTGAAFANCGFQPSHLAADDFQRAGIIRPPSIERSVAKRQAEFLAGRLCARAALGRLGLPGCDLPIGTDRAPGWPTGFCGAITHGDGWAAAIAAPTDRCRGLGLDVESLLAPERALRLAAEILTAAELERLPEDPQQAALVVTLTFSLKESLFKALYPLVGQRFYFEAASLLDWSEDGQARLSLLTDLSPDWRAGVQLAGQFNLRDGRLLSLVCVPA
ncbi:4'-phosphopantetheinyl transferase family protein [Pseudomonas massiliensis]|uniref:4'-phosphopantetheinyl transferase family protein n=1 Tax=Pseudomonas massiliensis TaxID=522492 RepID=UPI00058E9430|nr:4'-phosphopantetheinyl transferase superfamily protein [Pseudomonas massiliensis]